MICDKVCSEKLLGLGREPKQTALVGKQVGKGLATAGFASAVWLRGCPPYRAERGSGPREASAGLSGSLISQKAVVILSMIVGRLSVLLTASFIL
jgi:hypothetical protein